MGNDNFKQFHFATRINCPICQGQSAERGEKRGRYIDQSFRLRECLECTYAFIENPCIDFSRIYNEDYYNARGADPLTDYVFEMEHPEKSIRSHEHEGIVEAVRSIVGPLTDKSWLDFGSGNGGLIRYLNAIVPDSGLVAGFEEGWIADEARRNQIRVLKESDLEKFDGSFDVVTAIEVLEHVLDPVEVLLRIRRMLKLGGLFFYTTGNSAPFRKNLLKWSYVVPEIHIGFFNPKSMAVALERAAFSVESGRFLPGFEKIIHFKVLKNLGITRDSSVFNLVPWSIVSRLVNIKYRLSDLPTALAR